MTNSEDLSQADQLFDAGRYQDAAALYQRVLDSGTDEIAAHYGLGISAAAQGQHPQAVAHYRAVLLMDPGHANAAYQLGLVAETAGTPAEALRWYRQATIWNPDHAQAQRAINRLEARADTARSTSAADAPISSTGTANTAAADTARPGSSSISPPAPAAQSAIDAAPRQRSLAEELASTDFSTEHLHHGDPLTPRQGRLLRSYLGWLFAPALVIATAYAPLPAIGGALQPLQGQVTSVAASLSWPLLGCVVGLLLLSWITTIYAVYERRVDVVTGILRRKQRTLWFYEVSRAPHYRQSFIEMLTGTGSIILESDALPTRTRMATGHPTIGHLRLRSLAPINELKPLTEQMRTRQLYERRGMLDRFIGR